MELRLEGRTHHMLDAGLHERWKCWQTQCWSEDPVTQGEVFTPEGSFQRGGVQALAVETLASTWTAQVMRST